MVFKKCDIKIIRIKNTTFLTISNCDNKFPEVTFEIFPEILPYIWLVLKLKTI